jgi:hypothetical protein
MMIQTMGKYIINVLPYPEQQKATRVRKNMYHNSDTHPHGQSHSPRSSRSVENWHKSVHFQYTSSQYARMHKHTQPHSRLLTTSLHLQFLTAPLTPNHVAFFRLNLRTDSTMCMQALAVKALLGGEPAHASGR